MASIIVPMDPVVMLDIDGTLIDSSYSIADERIYAAVTDLQRSGWMIGLSSDTPLEVMQLWKQEFAMNGPLIAEKGSVVEVDGRVYCESKDLLLFSDARSAIVSFFAACGYVLWYGNPVDFIRRREKIGRPGETVVLVNTFRRCSLSFFVRTVADDGELVIDHSLTSSVVNSVRHLFPVLEDPDEDLNHQYGLIILMRKRINKRAGTLVLMEKLNLRQIGMVGNSLTDYVGNDIAVHYAVQDATDPYRQVAHFVSEFPVTVGVVDILNRLAGNVV